MLYHDSSATSSNESRSHRRLFSRILSSFTPHNDSAQTISNLARSLAAGQGQVGRLSGSTARDSSPRATSIASTESTETSLVPVDLARTWSANKPSSPNPLRAPPSSLLGVRRGDGPLPKDQRLASGSSLPGEIPPPALATATLRSVSDVTDADVGKATAVWVAVDVECGIHYAEDSASSLRSKALGPPHTDPGYLSKLRLHMAPASGCSILRLVGSESRDVLLPGDTWSIVAQILAEPPFRRKQAAQAFSLQNRPSSHALMDQLHTMLVPSDPSSQDLVHFSVTFEHMLLPRHVQCCVSEKLSLERRSTWSLESRRQGVRNRQSPQQAAPAADNAQGRPRDKVACKLLDVLELNLHGHATISDREAIEILDDFFDGSGGSVRLEQRARDVLGALQARIRPSATVGRAPVVSASPTKSRRNAIDLPRGGDQQPLLQLHDITNQWTSGSRTRRSPDLTPPAPLFSPRKRPSVKNLGCGPLDGGGKKGADCTGGADVGSPRFYEDELDEASRIWKGMRDSSAGDGRLEGPGHEGDGVHGEENGRCDVVGAPWL